MRAGAAWVGTHSLQAGRVVALALSGQNATIIKKIGRWFINTFLMYIHEQIAHLMVGVAEGIAQPLFSNIEGATTSGD